jgi:hypothetical protein
MNETVEKCIENMNKIQAKAYSLESITKVDKSTWKAMCRRIRELGYMPSYRKDKITKRVVWFAKTNEEVKMIRHFECDYQYTDVRPNHKTLKGDCTTRAMTYCMNGVMTYDEIESYQYRLAVKYGTRRNTNGTWGIVLTENGYTKIPIRKTKLSVVANILGKVLKSPVVAVVPGHATVIDVGGIVKDLWDCRGRGCKTIYVKTEEKDAVINILGGFRIRC